MNNVRMVTLNVFRTYATRFRRGNVGIRGKLKLSQSEGTELTPEEFEDDEMGAHESDFMNVAQSYTQHEREVKRAKELLKQRIVKSKYFKEVQPNFLTYTEKDQIKKLHDSNPEEWTPEKLSESFPALPETIRTILRSRWIPKSVDRIISYDTKVIENWKDFKKGKLAVDPDLNQHLMKFRNRIISLMDKDTLKEKFIPPKMEFPKPRSKTFSSIVTDCVDDKRSTDSKTKSSLKEKSDRNEKWIPVTKEASTEIAVVKQTDSRIVKNDGEKKHKEVKLTFDEFMKEKLNVLYEVSPEEGITLLQTYRKYMESKNSEDVSVNVSNDIEKQDGVKEKNVAVKENTPTKSALTVKETEKESKIAVTPDTESSSLDTYIKEWNSCVETKCDYVNRIKIPSNVYQQGMSYRIKDCYYDSDGEFLYRIPGLRG